MRRSRTAMVMVGFAAITTAWPGDGTYAAQPAVERLVKARAESLMEQYNIPGMAVAITAGRQQLFFTYGLASRETKAPVTANTLFELGSISKTFTATLATYAQANGQLSLSDHPGQYLPTLRGTPLDQASLADLGTHSAGGFPLQLPDDIQNTAQLMTYFHDWQPTYAPGTRRSYANPSIGLLGMIAATSMKMPFGQAMHDKLLPGLGLAHTYLNVPTAQLPLYAQGYDKNDQPVRLNPAVLAEEAYGFKSSARDMLHYVQAQIGAVALPAKLREALDATQRGYFKVGGMTQALIWEQYGYPVALDTLVQGNSNAVALTTQPTSPLEHLDEVWVNKTGSTNGFGGYVAFVPSRGIGVVLLANKNYPNEARVRFAHELVQALDQRLDK
ncbi:class C beta-lactamase [Pseudomonas sp. CFBP 13719]|uniref:class C beta-lactamase n=1 Tax=Pseudomonas sp. CFBP 13719 TaxID=2775303 RepID=UPI001FD62899|nr:class C beta-lactamase [Pseudomonas sp. CFBP 13719]